MNTIRSLKNISVVLPAIVLAALAMTACSKKEDVVTASEIAPDVPVTTVTENTLFRVDQLPGEIRAYQDVAVYPKVPGFIQWIGVDRGSKVKSGQLMVRLIAPELGAQRFEAKSKADAASGQVMEAKAKLSAAKATLLEATAQLAGDNDTYPTHKGSIKNTGCGGTQ